MTVTTNKKKRGAAFGIAGVLAVGLIAGGASAAMSKTINDGADTHNVVADQVNDFGFLWASYTGEIDADITMTTGSYGTDRITTPFGLSNEGSVPAQFAFYIDPDTVPTLDADNPIWDETTVIVEFQSGVVAGSENNEKHVSTLREFLERAYVSTKILQPGETTTVVVTILPASEFTWRSPDVADPTDIRVGAKATFNQLINPTESPLIQYAQDNRILVNDGYHLDPNEFDWGLVNQIGQTTYTDSMVLDSSVMAGLTL